MPGVTAGGNVGFVSGIPMSTPPQTPRSGTSGSGAGVKRDASESEREDGIVQKRRRVAPTVVPAEEPAAPPPTPAAGVPDGRA